MKITVRQAGGVVGHLPGLANVPGHRPLSVDTAALAPEQRAQIERLVEQAGIIENPRPSARSYAGAERLISVEVDGKTYTARFQEGDIPEEVAGLIEAVRAAAGQSGA
jgi:hypothetical protein